MRRLAILGSTGSIGQQTLDVVRAFPDKFRVVGLAAGNNTGLLAEQLSEFKPRLVYSTSSMELPGGARAATMEDIASHPDVDLVVVATSGKAGLSPTLAALGAGKKVALSNKEVLVMAGEIVMAEAQDHGAEILPVDSEHSAIWQCLRGEGSTLARLVLTASGGPFYRLSPSQLAKITVGEALQHPTWKMGKKVTIDSATLMNKGLEAIEAHWLFNMPLDRIDIVIHPQSIVHSVVEFIDGSVKAQMSFPDMHLPIQYALSYPERFPGSILPRLDLTQVGELSFEPVNQEVFPCLKLALEAANKGGTCPAVLCGADEVAVDLFLRGHIGFPAIAELLARTLDRHRCVANPELGEILAADTWARETAMDVAKRGSLC